jgi:hypothetical protein
LQRDEAENAEADKHGADRTLDEYEDIAAEDAVSRHLPPRPKPVPNAPGMFAFADPERVSEVLTAGRAAPRFEKLDLDLDIAAGRGRSS